MIEILSNLAELRAALVEQRRQGSAKRQEGEEQERLAEANLALLDLIEAEAWQLLGERRGADVSLESAEIEPSAARDAWSIRRARLEALFGCDWDSMLYLTPDHDEETGVPIYQPCVVSGQPTNRLRAFAAARVYGKTLRIKSLADSIYRTGETRATNSASVKSSLSGLIRYGRDWQRKDGGWLEYVGEGLSPNREMIIRLAGERQGQPRQVNES